MNAHSKHPHLLFGKGTLPVTLPSSVRLDVIEKPVMPVLADTDCALKEALDAPVDCRPLAELAREADSACILICDITRPVPNGVILPPLIRTLLDSGIKAEKIVVLIATGLHRPNLGEELRELVGNDWVLETVRVENHYAQDDAAHREIGVTSRGTHIRLDSRFLDADLKIVTGLVEPHFMAGYSGGRKVIAPGIAHADTIGTFHNTRFMEDPAARNCNFKANPLHGDQLETMAMIGPAFALNTCLDSERRLAFVNFGEIVASHEEAVRFMRSYAEVPLERSYRCVITSAAGWPLDLTYYQTIKGIVGALGCLAKGGSLLIASSCSEGLGSAEFREAQALLVERGVEGFLEEARRHPIARPDEWLTVKLTEALRDFRVHLYASGLDASQQRLTGVRCHDDWESAVKAVVEESAATEVAVIPEGPYVIPRSRLKDEGGGDWVRR